jgi:hypothetical protein
MSSLESSKQKALKISRSFPFNSKRIQHWNLFFTNLQTEWNHLAKLHYVDAVRLRLRIKKCAKSSSPVSPQPLYCIHTVEYRYSVFGRITISCLILICFKHFLMDCQKHFKHTCNSYINDLFLKKLISFENFPPHKLQYCQKMLHFLHTTILTMCTAKKSKFKLEARTPLRCRLS